MARAAHLDMSSTIARAHDAQRDGAGSLAAPRCIPLNIAPLLAPHKKHGRLSLRIERLPQKSRLSRGSRNNDGSWSLATDELEDLTYQLPPGLDADHSLGIRIISLAHGNTLAVLDFVVSPADTTASVDEVAAPPRGDDARADTQAQHLRAELAKLKAALAARDTELAEARQSGERPVAHPAPNPETALIAARALWKVELEECLTELAAQAEAHLQLCRDEWRTEQDARSAELEARAQQQTAEMRERGQRETQDALLSAEAEWKADEAARLAAAQSQSVEKLATLEQALVERDAALARANEAAAQLREDLRRASQEAVLKAEQIWKTAEATRLAAAQAQWREASARELSDARATAGTAHDQHAETERRELREKLASLEATLAAREIALARATEASEQAQARWQRELQDALSKAEQAWLTDEAARFAVAEAQWQAQAATALAEARAQTGANDDRKHESDLHHLRGQLTALQATLAERDAAFALAGKDSEQARQRAQREAQDAIAKAEQTWKTDEAARLTIAQAQWQAKSAKASTTASGLITKGGDAEAQSLRERLSTLEATIAARDAELAEAQEEITDARERLEQGAQDALVKAERGEKADDAAWLAAAEAAWRKKHAGPLAEATARYEAAEGALAQIRIRTKDDGRVHQELDATRAALAVREAELTDMRLKLGLSGESTSETETDAEGGAAMDPTAPQAEQSPAPYSPAFIGSVIAAACMFATAIVFYPSIEALVFDAPAPPAKTAAEPKVVARLAPVPEQRLATLVRDAKLRADPSSSAKAVATVPRGASVSVLEQRGKWTLVRVEGKDGKTESKQGWVTQSMLKDSAASDAPPSAPKAN